MSDEEVEVLRRWHEDAYDELRRRGPTRVNYLGKEFAVPADVFAPTPMSDLLGTPVLNEVREADRVLDMGTGCGVNAILAASKARDVIIRSAVSMVSAARRPRGQHRGRELRSTHAILGAGAAPSQLWRSGAVVLRHVWRHGLRERSDRARGLRA